MGYTKKTLSTWRKTRMLKHDYITVIHTITNNSIGTGSKIGKHYSIDKETGNLVKSASVNETAYSAVTIPIENVHELDAILRQCDEYQAIILGYVKGTEDGEPYFIRSEAYLKKALNMKNRPVGLFEIDDHKCAGRFKENFTYSSWILFDRDVADDLPDILKKDTPEDYLRQISTVVPNLYRCSYLIIPSSTNRIIPIDQDVSTETIKNCHIYVQVDDIDDIVRFRKDLQIKLFANDLGYAKLNVHNVSMRRTIVDTSVLSPERVVFESKPSLSKEAQKQYRVADQVSIVHDDIDNHEHTLNTSVVIATEDEKRKVADIYAMHYNNVDSDSNVDVHVAQLTLDTEITTKNHGVITVDEYLAQFDGTKLRCQTTPFRESSSWNGILDVNSQGAPHLYDNGSHCLYVLPPEPPIANSVKSRLAEAYGGNEALEVAIKKLQGQSSNASDVLEGGQPLHQIDEDKEIAIANTLQVQTETTWDDVHEGQFVEEDARIASGEGLTERRLDKDYEQWDNELSSIPWDLNLKSGVNIIDDRYHKTCPITDLEMEMSMDLASTNFPSATRTANGALTGGQKCTVRQVRYAMNVACYSVRYNQLTDEQEYKMPIHQMHYDNGKEELVRDVNYQDQMIVEAASYLNMTHKNKIIDAVDAIARDNQFHPWRDWINSVKWDGVDRTDLIMDTIKLIDPTVEDELKQIYLHRYSLQVIEGMYAKNPQSLRMCLTFSGNQKIGKTEWFKWFIGGRCSLDYAYFKPSFNISGTSKDAEMMESNRKFVLVELGELDATFRKADIAHVKGFISRDIDSYRAPYARKTRTSPRRVIYCATVNDKQFLADRTGNTRFPTLGVDKLDWELMNQMIEDGSLQQFWAQRKVEWLAGEKHHMTAEEDAMQLGNEEDYLLESHAEQHLIEYFDDLWERPKELWGAVTVSELIDGLNLSKLDRKDVKRFMTSHFGKPSGRSDRVATDKERKPHNIGKRCAFYAPLGRVNGVHHGKQEAFNKIKAGTEIEEHMNDATGKSKKVIKMKEKSIKKPD